MILTDMQPTYKVVVPLSGGKDSQACLKAALQHFSPSEVCALFCDTQFDHPDTYVHVDKLRTLYGNVGFEIVSGGSVLEKVLKHGRFPGGGARHCTDELKIRETRIFLKNLIQFRQPKTIVEVWYGMRSGESTDRKKRYAGKISTELYHPHEVLPRKYPKYLGKQGIRFRLPILDWTTDEVFAFLEGEQHPHYAMGFSRVGCFPCLAAGDAAKRKAFEHDGTGAGQYKQVSYVSAKIGKSVWTSKAEIARHAVCQLMCSE